MATFLEDPSVLTKDKLKGELTANNVTIPNGEHKKEVYVQLYLKNLTVLNKTSQSPDTFSSDDDELPVVSNKSRSGRKATRKTDKPRSEVEVTDLTDEGLRDQLLKHGVDTGPIVASTRKLYEKKLQQVLDQPALETRPRAPETATTLIADTKADSNQNGNTQSDQYSDKEDEEIVVPDSEPVPVVDKPVRSRGKTPVTLRTGSRRQNKVEEKEASGGQTPKKGAENVVEDILADEISTPTGISATCRRPIRGAAGRPVKASNYWLDESLLQRSVLTESYSECLSRAAAPGKAPARRGFLSVLMRLLLLIVVAGSLYYAYENLDVEQINSLKGLLDSVAIPLGLGSESVALSGEGME